MIGDNNICMKRLVLFCFCVLMTCCTSKNKNEYTRKKVVFDQELADELARMAEIDQIAAFPAKGKYENLSGTEWRTFKDSVFTSNQIRAEEILNEFGYPGVDRVGEVGSSDYWVIVQHSDFIPDFQKRVLDQMEKEVKKDNADKSNFALLTDRYRLNTGQKQVYGSQVTYNEYEQAIPRPLKDSMNVNIRRAQMDLEPIEVYLNDMTLMHFEMNKEYFESKEIVEPVLYEVKE